jgi:hypothetical protein
MPIRCSLGTRLTTTREAPDTGFFSADRKPIEAPGASVMAEGSTVQE